MTAFRRRSTTRSIATSIPNEVYHYGIYAIYAMADGKLFPAPGVVVSARPQPPISTLEAPRLLVEPSGRIRIDWVEPARGSVKITADSRAVAAPDGHAAFRPGRPTRSMAAGSRRLLRIVRSTRSRRRRATVITRRWSSGVMTATVGNSVALSRVTDPTELRATRSGEGLGTSTVGMRVTLRWKWAGVADATLIVARQGTAPQGPDDPAAITAMVIRDDYDRHRMLDSQFADAPPVLESRSRPPCPRLATGSESPGRDNGPWYIRVFSVLNLDGVRSISPGLEPTAATVLPGPHPEVTVSYVLKRPWIPGLPWSLSFRTDPPGTAIPPMVLVAHQRVVPLSVDDGQIVARFPSGGDGAAFPVRIPPKLPRQHARVFP